MAFKPLPNMAEEIRALVGDGDSLPPVEQWHPERVGDIDIRIGRDGHWFYQGEEMTREAVVRLFSTILRKDDDGYCLVTPAEKMRIQVEDAPFVVRLMDVEGEGQAQTIHFSTNVGDSFTLSANHPLRVYTNENGDPKPYVKVRRNLEALVSRSVYYELADLAVPKAEGSDDYGVWSTGEFFQLK